MSTYNDLATALDMRDLSQNPMKPRDTLFRDAATAIRSLIEERDAEGEKIGAMFMNANAARLALERGDADHAMKMIGKCLAIIDTRQSKEVDGPQPIR